MACEASLGLLHAMGGVILYIALSVGHTAALVRKWKQCLVLGLLSTSGYSTTSTTRSQRFSRSSVASPALPATPPGPSKAPSENRVRHARQPITRPTPLPSPLLIAAESRDITLPD